ncbi:MAG: PfkB family carbohydrate kinase [Coriobacteriia bacterium]|nr:PfkB family carbohydrate kinase [Coriobacteriia bacterium]
MRSDSTPKPPRDARVVVVGGANTDVVGIPAGVLVPRDSNPGHVRLSAGGVARNIAENLARLGVETHLITAFGSDPASSELAAACQLAGVDVGASLIAEGLPGARYLAIVDETRDLAVAVNDMRVLDLLTPEALEADARMELLAAATLVVADANLPAATLVWLATHVSAPLVLDTVSAAKAPRAAAILGQLAAIKTSALESGALLGRRVEDLADARSAAEELVARGVGAAFVSCGPAGAAWADGGASGTLPAPDVTVASTNGAGDAFAAGVTYGLLTDVGTETAARLGSAVASIALEDEETVSSRVSLEAVAARMKERA